jgi:hypothetical protein
MVRELVPHLQAIAQEGSAFPLNIRRSALMILHHLLATLASMRGAFQSEVRRCRPLHARPAAAAVHAALPSSAACPADVAPEAQPGVAPREERRGGGKGPPPFPLRLWQAAAATCAGKLLHRCCCTGTAARALRGLRGRLPPLPQVRNLMAPLAPGWVQLVCGILARPMSLEGASDWGLRMEGLGILVQVRPPPLLPCCWLARPAATPLLASPSEAALPSGATHCTEVVGGGAWRRRNLMGCCPPDLGFSCTACCAWCVRLVRACVCLTSSSKLHHGIATGPPCSLHITSRH